MSHNTVFRARAWNKQRTQVTTMLVSAAWETEAENMVVKRLADLNMEYDTLTLEIEES